MTVGLFFGSPTAFGALEPPLTERATDILRIVVKYYLQQCPTALILSIRLRLLFRVGQPATKDATIMSRPLLLPPLVFVTFGGRRHCVCSELMIYLLFLNKYK